MYPRHYISHASLNSVLTDDNQIYNIFASQSTQQFMQLSKPEIQPLDQNDAHFEFDIIPTLSATNYKRRNYTVINLLGDVAAVYTGLSAIFGILLIKVFQTKALFNNYLINEVFRHREGDSGRTQHVKTNIWMRMQIKYFPKFLVRRFTKNEDELAQMRYDIIVGQRRVDRFLDIKHFMRKMIETQYILQGLTTKRQRDKSRLAPMLVLNTYDKLEDKLKRIQNSTLESNSDESFQFSDSGDEPHHSHKEDNDTNRQDRNGINEDA